MKQTILLLVFCLGAASGCVGHQTDPGPDGQADETPSVRDRLRHPAAIYEYHQRWEQTDAQATYLMARFQLAHDADVTVHVDHNASWTDGFRLFENSMWYWTWPTTKMFAYGAAGADRRCEADGEDCLPAHWPHHDGFTRSVPAGTYVILAAAFGADHAEFAMDVWSSAPITPEWQDEGRTDLFSAETLASLANQSITIDLDSPSPAFVSHWCVECLVRNLTVDTPDGHLKFRRIGSSPIFQMLSEEGWVPTGRPNFSLPGTHARITALVDGEAETPGGLVVGRLLEPRIVRLDGRIEAVGPGVFTADGWRTDYYYPSYLAGDDPSHAPTGG